jgi:outer membrane protein
MAQSPAASGLISLQMAIGIGLRESPAVRAALADARAAAAEKQAARSMTLPQLSANTYLTYGDSSSIFATSPGVSPANYLAVQPHGFADQNVMLMAPIYTGGRLRNLVRGASAKEGAATADSLTAQAETALQIKLAYYRTLLAGEIVKSAQSRLDAAAALLETMRARVEAGKEIEAAAQRVQAEQADAQRAVASARNDQAKALLDLKAAMGVDLGKEISPSEALAFHAPSGDLPAALKQATNNRPELHAARLRLAAAAAQTGAARGSQQPQLYGTAMADGFGGHDLSGGSYTVGVTVSVALIDAGQRRAEIAGARAMQERAEAEARSVELAVSKEVRQAWLDVETAAANYSTAQEALASAQAAYDVTTLRVQNQKAILVEQLDALAALTQARTNLAAALFDNSVALARLQRAEGVM